MSFVTEIIRFWKESLNNNNLLPSFTIYVLWYMFILQSDDPNATIAVILDSLRALVRLN